MGEKKVFTYKTSIMPTIPSWTELEKKITNANIKSQHETTGTKIEIARYHLEKIFVLLPNQQLTDMIEIAYDKETNMHKIIASRTASKYLAFSSELDSFLYSLRGCIDSLLLEINSIYGLNLEDYKVTAKNLKKKMNFHCKQEQLTNYLASTFQSHWFNYLTDLRNTVVHHINFPFYVSIDLKAPNCYPLYLPDEPNASKISLNNDYKILPKLNELLIETANFLSISYGLINKSNVSLKL
jgi:hypothetical protein